MLVTLIAFRFVLKLQRLLLNRRFYLPGTTVIDGRLLGARGYFGIGWGVYGYCPGPAISALTYLDSKTAMFVAAMLVGMALANKAAAGDNRPTITPCQCGSVAGGLPARLRCMDPQLITTLVAVALVLVYVMAIVSALEAILNARTSQGAVAWTISCSPYPISPCRCTWCSAAPDSTVTWNSAMRSSGNHGA